MTESSAIASIRAEPSSDELRLSFANTCEASDPERAELIRLQCKLANNEASANSASDRKIDAARVKALLAENIERWVGPDWEAVRFPNFTRGFLEEVEFSPDADPAVLTRLLALHPIRDLLFTDDLMEDQPDLIASQLERWAAAPVLGRMESLKSEEAEIGAAGWRVLLESPHKDQLRALELSDHDSNPEVAAAIAAAPMQQVQQIRFVGHMAASLGDAGVQLLASSPNLSGLLALDLWNCRCGSGAAQAIASSEHLHRLERLHFGGGSYATNELGPEGGQALGSAAHLRQLRVLNLDFNSLTDDGAGPIPESEGLPALEVLSLQANELTNVSVRCFMSAHQRLPKLRALNLAHNDIDGGGAEFLAGCKLMEQLDELSLYHNNVGPSGVYALCNSFKTTSLKRLNLTQNPLGAESAKVADALIQSPALQGLEQLDIERCQLEDGDRQRLREHFGARVRS